MAIVMKEIKGGVAPLIICDGCGKEISDVSNGNVLWDDDETGEFKKVYHSHKGRCDLIVEKRYLKCYSGDELKVHLWYLLHNLKYDAEKADENVGIRRKVGLEASDGHL